MVDLETLLDLRLTSLLLPAWPVMLYVALVSVFLLMRRIRLCLLTSYLFTFYWGILLHWGTFLSTGTYLTAFIVYTICGVAVAVLAIAASFSEPARDKRQSKERESTPRLFPLTAIQWGQDYQRRSASTLKGMKTAVLKREDREGGNQWRRIRKHLGF